MFTNNRTLQLQGNGFGDISFAGIRLATAAPPVTEPDAPAPAPEPKPEPQKDPPPEKEPVKEPPATPEEPLKTEPVIAPDGPAPASDPEGDPYSPMRKSKCDLQPGPQ